VGGAEGVVFAFAAFGEAGEAAALADGVEAVFAAGQDFVGVALVADIEDELIIGGVENGVDGGGEFDHAKSCAQVTTGFCDGVDHEVADFVVELLELVIGEGF